MNKKFLGRITAASLAAMSAVSVLSVTASAINLYTNGIATGYVYKYTDDAGNTTYYTDSAVCKEKTGSYGTAVTVTDAFGYNSYVHVIDNVVYSGYRSGSQNYSTRYYDYYDDDYYYDGVNGYYDVYGIWHWYDNWHYYDSYYDYDTYDVYKVGSYYYPTLSSALSAAGSDYSKLTKVYDYSAPQTNYFSKTTGKYYSTYNAALAASDNYSGNVYSFNYYANDNYYDNYYYNGYYYDGSYYNGYYYDPYYYYWYQKYYNTSNTTSKDTTTATIGNRKGWTSIASYLKTLKSGSSVSVAMNEETSVPSSVMSAIKGKDITVKFVLDNGVTFTVNGKDISSAKEFSIDTAYNTSNVPTKLVQAAYKKNDAVSTAQISVDSNSFGAKVDITVKFATKRAGCTAKLYRYNASKGTLSLVDSSTVQSTGKCTFDGVAKGGNFVVVLC